jgi:uncharacterized protein (DUF1778 family)
MSVARRSRRNRRILVSLSDDERRRLGECAARADMTMSDFVRRLIAAAAAEQEVRDVREY